MIRLTDFSKFRMAVEESFGLPVLAAEIKRVLQIGDMDADPENLIVGEAGIYSIIEREGNLFLTRVILHIADYDIQWLDKVGRETARVDFYADRFDSPALVKAVHKYHFFFCQTLNIMFSQERGHRYKQSHRQDGKFAYKFTDKQTTLHDSKNQILNPCGNCMGIFRHATDSKMSVNKFHPSMFFDKIPQLQWLPDCGYELDTQHMPETYAKDYREIHAKAKQKKKYCCESCGIDLSAPHLQKYSDCHHGNANRADNNPVNLKCLCVKHHAEQFQHSHMKQSQRYLDFLPIWKEIMRDA